MKVILLLALSVCAHAQFFGGNAAKIRGKNVKGSLSCADGDAITWVTANNQFECAAPGAVGSSVGVKKAGTLIGTRAAINLIEGANVTLTVTDDAGNNEVDVTVAASGGGSGVAVENNGSAVATEATINFVPGTYTTVSATDAGSKVNVTFDVDTGTVLTKATSQAGGLLYCAGTASGGASTCSVSPALTTYTTGQFFVFVPDATLTAAHTLNINSQGAVSLKMADNSDPSASNSLTSGRSYVVVKEASAFRVIGTPASSSSIAPIVLPIGTCNTGPTYVGGAWFFSTGVAPSCSVLFTGFTALNIPRMNFDTQNDETVAAFMWPAGAGTSVTFRAKWSYSLTTTPTVEASIACHADNGDMTAAPASPSEITPVSMSFNTAWTTANRLNEGTVTMTNAAFTANKACWIKLKRTDAGGGNLFMHNLPRLEF